VTGVRAAVVPRVLDPGKFVVGGRDMIPRFTGISLLNGTAMGLSIPGEMYANFGLGGAIVGTFLYAVALGLLYRAFVRRARASVLWWAWAPFIFFSTLSAEQGFAENANAVTKTLLIMWVFVKVVPAWRALPRRLVRRRAPLGTGIAVGDPNGRPATLAP